MNERKGTTVAARHEIASEWAVRLAARKLSMEEELGLELWLQEDEGNRTLLGKMVALWDATAQAGSEPELIGVRADALDAMRNANRRRWSGRGAISRWRVLAAAACLLLVVCSAILLNGARPDVYSSGVGEQRGVTLADGSRIFLDADTRIEVALNDERRSLRLIKGRAKFDVAKDPRRPFMVEAGKQVVVATGTSFSVELIHSRMQVVLYEGSVAVLADGPNDAPPRHLVLAGTREHADHVLKPGTMLVGATDLPIATVQPIDASRSLSWQSGQLSFSGEPLSEAVERVNRYSPDKIVVVGRDTAAIRINGVFNEGDTDGFIDGVIALYHLGASRSGNVITLSRPSTAS